MAKLDFDHIHTQMLDAIGEAVIATDLQGTIQYWNHAAEEIYQWRADEVIGKNIVDVTPASTSQQQAEEIMQVLEKGATWTGEFEVQRKDGSGFLAYVSDSPIYNEQGEFVGIIGISRDLTTQLREEASYQLRESQLNEAQKVAAIGSWTYDVKIQQLTWTVQMFRLFGIDPKDGEPTYDEHRKFVHPDDWELFDKSVQETVEIGIGYDIEIRLVQPSGNTIWVNAGCETRKENGKVVELFGTTQDITIQKEAEAEIKKLKSFYEEVTENVQDGIWVTNKDDVIFYANRGMETIAGVSREIIMGKNILKDFPKETTEKFNVFYRKAKRDLKPTWYEVTVMTPAGVNMWQNGWLVPVLTNGCFDGIICTIRDVTERKQTEQAFQESQERFERAMEATQDGLYDWNLVTNEIYYSPSWKSMLGYAYDELPNDFSVWETHTAPEDVKQSWVMQQELINKERDRFEIEFKMKHKDGHWVDILSRAYAFFDEKDVAVRIVGTHVDISEHKQILKTLQDRNTYIETILENMPIGFAVNTIDDGDVIFMNNLFEEIYGWSRDVLTNTSIFFERVFPEPEFREKMRAKIISDMASGDPERMRWNNLKIVTSTGEVKYVYAFNIPLLDQNLMISTVQDITERKQAEDGLKKLNATLDERVQERTEKLNILVNTMVGRETRMAELKKVITILRTQLKDAGITPIAFDPLLGPSDEW